MYIVYERMLSKYFSLCTCTLHISHITPLVAAKPHHQHYILYEFLYIARSYHLLKFIVLTLSDLKMKGVLEKKNYFKHVLLI